MMHSFKSILLQALYAAYAKHTSDQRHWATRALGLAALTVTLVLMLPTVLILAALAASTTQD